MDRSLISATWSFQTMRQNPGNSGSLAKMTRISSFFQRSSPPSVVHKGQFEFIVVFSLKNKKPGFWPG
jgi:hypothetical protein